MYLTNLNLNKITCAYIVNITLEVPENLVLEAISL